MASYIAAVENASVSPSKTSEPLYLFNIAPNLKFLKKEMKPTAAVRQRLSFRGDRADIFHQQFYLGPPNSGAPLPEHPNLHSTYGPQPLPPAHQHHILRRCFISTASVYLPPLSNPRFSLTLSVLPYFLTPYFSPIKH